jgi:acetamidase/formamidase
MYDANAAPRRAGEVAAVAIEVAVEVEVEVAVAHSGPAPWIAPAHSPEPASF